MPLKYLFWIPSENNLPNCLIALGLFLITPAISLIKFSENDFRPLKDEFSAPSFSFIFFSVASKSP